MADLRYMSNDQLLERYYLILNNRIKVTNWESLELQNELQKRDLKDDVSSSPAQFEIFSRCLDVDKIRQYVKQAFTQA